MILNITRLNLFHHLNLKIKNILNKFFQFYEFLQNLNNFFTNFSINFNLNLLKKILIFLSSKYYARKNI